MITQRKWIVLLGVIVVAAAALALGVGLGTLLLMMGAVLLCPAAMYFGMQGMGMQQGCGQAGKCHHSNASDVEYKTETQERPKAA